MSKTSEKKFGAEMKKADTHPSKLKKSHWCVSEGAFTDTLDAPIHTGYSVSTDEVKPVSASETLQADDEDCTPLMANITTVVPAALEDLLLLSNQLVIERVSEEIFVTAIAVDVKNPNNNLPRVFNAGGDPLGGYAYTPSTDEYVVNCANYYSLGLVSLCFRIYSQGCAARYFIPLPEDLLYKHLNFAQKNILKSFKDQNKDCEIQYVQSISRE